MICIPRNGDFEDRKVKVTKMSFEKSAGSSVRLPATLQAFARMTNLNLKVKIITKHCPLRTKSMSVGSNTKLKRQGLQLSTKKYKLRNLKRFHFPISTLSDRFKRDNTILLKCPWEKKNNHTRRKESKQPDLEILSKFDKFSTKWSLNCSVNTDPTKKNRSNHSLQCGFQRENDVLKNKIQIPHNYKNYLREKSSDSTTKISSNDLRHKLNLKRVSISPTYDKCLKYKRVSFKLTRPTNSEISGCISKTIVNDYCSEEEKLSESDIDSSEENLFKNFEMSLPQKNHPISGLSLTKTIINENLKCDFNHEIKKPTASFSSNDDIKNIEVPITSPKKVNSQITKCTLIKKPLINKTIIKQKNNTNTSEHDLDSSGDENSCRHPNRRLQGERMQQGNAATKSLNNTKPIKIEPFQSPPKSLKASEMWEDILRTPDFWEVDDSSDKMAKSDSCDKKIDYHGMLESFVFDDVEEKIRSTCDTLYEKRFLEKQNNPNFRQLLSKFYIPPAQVEVFHQILTDNLTALESLNEVCKARKWPSPQYIQLQQPVGFKFCCHLMGRKFVPMKSALNEALAKELAASECLDWLGILQRKSEIGSACCEFTEDTYFS